MQSRIGDSLAGRSAAPARLPAADRLAVALGYVVNPLILPPLLFGSVLIQFGAPWQEVGLATFVAFAFMTLVPLLCLLWMFRRGRTAALHVVGRTQRGLLFMVGMVSTAAASAIVVMFLETAREFVLGVGLCIFVAGATLSLLNRRWKVSIHAAAIAGFVAVVAIAAYWTASLTSQLGWIAPLVPAVMWARVRTGSHTASEVLAGAAVGVVVPAALLFGMAAMGLI